MTEISELVGTAVAPYSGDDRGVIILPKKYAMLSFRSTRSGDLVNVLVILTLTVQAMMSNW